MTVRPSSGTRASASRPTSPPCDALVPGGGSSSPGSSSSCVSGAYWDGGAAIYVTVTYAPLEKILDKRSLEILVAAQQREGGISKIRAYFTRP